MWNVDSWAHKRFDLLFGKILVTDLKEGKQEFFLKRKLPSSFFVFRSQIDNQINVML